VISWLIHKLSDLLGYEDKTAVMQTLPKPTERFDYTKARAGYYRAKARTETGRLLAKPKRRTHDNVVPMRKVGR